MAQLILTEEEKAAATWLELDDATIGKLVKQTTLTLIDSSDEQKRVWWFSAALMLCGIAVDARADHFSQEVLGFTRHDDDQGDWRVTVERINRKDEHEAGNGTPT